MSTIKVVSFDASMSNFGICKATVEVESRKATIDSLELVKTEPERRMQVRKDSDDLRRLREIREGMLKACEGMQLVIAEIPFRLDRNSPAAPAANFNAGAVTATLAGCPLPIIQVFPQQVKKYAMGSRLTSKEEMIEWFMTKYPNAQWRMRKLRDALVPTADNEHLADAIAILETGLATAQFVEMSAMYAAAKAA